MAQAISREKIVEHIMGSSWEMIAVRSSLKGQFLAKS